MIVYEYENNSVVERNLSEDEKSQVVNSINSKWTTWSSPIEKLRRNRNSVTSRAVPKTYNAEDKKDWHSKIELNRPYEYYSKLYGLLYETFYDKISSYIKMGVDRYKEVYNRAFSIENKKNLLVCLKDLLDSGEIVASAELKNTYKKSVLPIEQISMVDPANIVSIREKSFVVKEKTGEEISFVRINPMNFAYDPLVVPGTKAFDGCDKIVKQWKTKQEILTNKSFEITKAELDQIISDNQQPNEKTLGDSSDKDQTVRYNQIEVLTYYGDFSIDGRYYEDYVAVVIGRSKLVYFKPKGLYTPGIYYFPYHAIGSGSRGVSPLLYILDLCDAEEKIFNSSIDFMELQKNPPKYAPVGFFEEEVTKLSPGKNITYKPGMQDPTAIINMTFNAQPLQLFQEATKQLEKEIAGIDNGQLSEKSEALTEIEVKRIATSENLIPNMIISGILLHIISKYLKDCVQIIENQEFDESIIKTAWEFANEQLQMQNVIGLLKEIGAADPTMVKLQDSAVKVMQTMGVNPSEYLNTGREQQIIQNFAGLSDEVLQQLAIDGQKLQIMENNRKKAQKMMSNIQDSEYRSVLKKAWDETGMLPESVIVPNGQGIMEVPVEGVTPDTQVQNKVSTTAN